MAKNVAKNKLTGFSKPLKEKLRRRFTRFGPAYADLGVAVLGLTRSDALCVLIIRLRNSHKNFIAFERSGTRKRVYV